MASRLNEGLTQAPGTGGPDRHTCWLATINADGSPHVTRIGASWVDDAFWFQTGEAHPQGAQPRARPPLHAERRDARVRSRRRGRRPPDRRPPDRRGHGGALGRGGLAVPGGTRRDALTADYSAPSAGPPPWSSTASARGPRPRSPSSSPAGRPDGDSDRFAGGPLGCPGTDPSPPPDIKTCPAL